jgi:hypothetical protein
MTIEVKNTGNQIYVSIKPVKAKFTDNGNSTRLFISSIVDYGLDQATINWELRSEPVEAEYEDVENGGIVTSEIPSTTYGYGSHTITGEDYEGWTDNNAYIFEILLDILGLEGE